MKVYVDFKCLDAEDMPSNISNQYNLKVRSINGGSEYRNVELVALTDYTKQVRKEVCDEIRKQLIYYPVSLLDEAGRVKDNVWGISMKDLIDSGIVEKVEE